MEKKFIKGIGSWQRNFLSENREPKGYTKKLSISTIHIFINIYKYVNPVWRPCDNSVLTVQKACTGINSKYNQSALSKISMGDKYNDAVFVNPKITRKTWKYIFVISYVYIHNTYMYTHIHILKIVLNK